MPTPQLTLLVSAVKTALKGANGGALSRPKLNDKVSGELDASYGDDKQIRKQQLELALEMLVGQDRIYVEGDTVAWLKPGQKRPIAAGAAVEPAEPEKKKAKKGKLGAAERKAKNGDDTDLVRRQEKRKAEAEATTAEDADAAKVSTKAHVSNLPFSMKEESIRELFENCGTITEFALLKDQQKTSRGIAFVTFETRKGLKKALKLDGQECEGRPFKVSTSISKGERESTGPKIKKVLVKGTGRRGGFSIFVGGLPYTVAQADVRSHFEACGEIDVFDMPINKSGKRKGTTKGVAYIKFTTMAARESALELHQTELGGRKLVVEARTAAAEVEAKNWKTKTETIEMIQSRQLRKQTPTEEKEDDTADDATGTTKGKGRGRGRGRGEAEGKGKGKDKGKDSGNSREFEAFIGGLPYTLDQAIIRRDFSECGDIARMTMPLDDEGNSKGIAFINFRTKEALDKAVLFDGKDYGGMWIRVQKANAPRSTSVRAEDDVGKGKGKGDETERKPADPKLQGSIVKSQGKRKVLAESEEE